MFNESKHFLCTFMFLRRIRFRSTKMEVFKEKIQTHVCHSWVNESIPSCSCRKISPRSKRHSALAATQLTARISIDSSWSAAQMENRLALLFHKQFKEKTGQRFSFTYLQVGCIHNLLMFWSQSHNEDVHPSETDGLCCFRVSLAPESCLSPTPQRRAGPGSRSSGSAVTVLYTSSVTTTSCRYSTGPSKFLLKFYFLVINDFISAMKLPAKPVTAVSLPRIWVRPFFINT